MSVDPRLADPAGTEHVVVAPREIHDLVYRCGRVSGLDAGAAHRLGESVTYAHIHDEPGIASFLAALDDDTICTALAALDQLALAEVAAHQGQTATATFTPPVPRPLLLLGLQEAAQRGVLCATELAEGCVVSCALSVGTAPAADHSASADAARNGIAIARSDFDRLNSLAATFLVAEATLDAIVG